MTVRKRNTADGVITFHRPSALSCVTSEEPQGVVLKHTGSSGQDSRRTPALHSGRTRSSFSAGARSRRKRDGARVSSQPPWGPWVDPPFQSPQRRLQARLDVQHLEANATIQPSLDTEHRFMKELDGFLYQRDLTELRRKELQHKRWMERVWLPIQRRVEENVSARHSEMNENLHHVSRQYVDHCNAKGFVFLDIYDPREYDPFLLKTNKPHYYTIKTPALRDPLLLPSRKRMKENRAMLCSQTGRPFPRRPVEEVSPLPLRDAMTSRTELPLLTPPRKPHRSSVTPHQMTVMAATPDPTAEPVFSGRPHSKDAPSS